MALAAGHHNLDGGDATEIKQTAEMCQALARAVGQRGANVRVVTPNGGFGTFPGRVFDVGAKVVEWDRAGWACDLFLELHTQGAPDPRERGVFAIFPHAGSDTDIDARDELGPLLAEAIGRATGLPGGHHGILDEQQTAVGLEGYRLGVFKATEPIKEHCTRLILEVGAHTSPEDMAIIKSLGFYSRAASAAGEAIVAWANAQT